MSVIVYRDGVMAADSRAYSGCTTPIGAKMKIHRLNDGSLLGITSSVVGIPEAVVAWFNKGEDINCHPVPAEFDALLVRPSGEVFFYSDGFYPSGPLVGPYWSTGSGERYAMGAMAFGATAIQAAAVASGFDPMCAVPITSMPLHPAPASDSQKAE
jgi:hypothetical protein